MSVLESIFGTKDTAEAAIKEIEDSLLPKAKAAIHEEITDSLIPELKAMIANYKAQAKVKIVDGELVVDIELVEKNPT